MSIITIEKSEVLVIGSGAAGIRAAIELYDNKVDVLVVGKCAKRDAHTLLATGGINAALGTMDPKDSWQLHAADTIKDGGGINDTDAVQILCKNASREVKQLAKWGCPFHKEKDGSISQRFFGAATYRRAAFAGDYTGKHILTTLIDQAVKRKIRFKPEVYIFSLLKNKGRINGALGLELRTGKIITFHAKAVVLCSGGHSRMYKRSSSRFFENNGDGIHLAYDVGAKFMDMELFQFHPTGMLWPKQADGVLVTEAVRGEGGILTNAKGERFMKKYDALRMELSARDIVARAIYMEVKAGRGTKRGGVWLDISHKPKAYIKNRLPRMFKQFKEYCNIDISKQKMEVAPTAHYSMGGVLVNHNTGKTSVPGLYAIGEVTSGVHGGNRLGGNSLAECIVFGRLTPQNIIRDLKKMKRIPLNEKMIKEKEKWLRDKLSSSGQDPTKVKAEMQKIMWACAGVVRKGKDMEKALKEIAKFKQAKLKTGKNLKMNKKLIDALDVGNAFPTCEMIIKGALMRKESRAAHSRSDYPKEKASWKKNIIYTPTKKGVKLSTRGVKKVSQEIAKFLKGKREIKLLE